MARMTVESESLTRVANKIREKNRSTEPLAFPDGFESGVDNVFAAGEKSEYDRFWDEYQKKGKRTDYYCGFGGYGWHTGTFYPKYTIKPTNAKQMFWYFGQQSSPSAGLVSVDLVERLSECGVTLDFSKCTTFSNAFAYAKFIRVGEINTTGATALNNIFKNACITTIDRLVLRGGAYAPNPAQTFSDAFYNAKKLTDVTVSGAIAKSIDLRWSTMLSKQSIVSFVNALWSTCSGFSITLSLNAVNTAFETSLGAADGSSSDEWAELAQTKTSWNINLV